LEKQTAVYPNPVNDILKVEIQNNIKIETLELFDVLGKRIKVFDKDKKVLHLSEILSGIYILVIKTDKGIVRKKIRKI